MSFGATTNSGPEVMFEDRPNSFSKRDSLCETCANAIENAPRFQKDRKFLQVKPPSHDCLLEGLSPEKLISPTNGNSREWWIDLQVRLPTIKHHAIFRCVEGLEVIHMFGPLPGFTGLETATDILIQDP